MSKIKISEHKLVPKHELMTDSEIDAELGNVDYEIENLPKIKFDDPVVKYMREEEHEKIQEGDILRITRRSDTAGEFITYRIVEE